MERIDVSAGNSLSKFEYWDGTFATFVPSDLLIM